MAGRVVAWFSCGAASAVAAKLTVEKYGSRAVVAYCDLMESEHDDNARFFADVQCWLGVPILRLASDRYSNIDDVFERRRYMAGIKGAICTTELKKMVRERWQRIDDIHVFGYTADEQRRADDFEENNQGLAVEWILIDAGVTKVECHERIEAAGIASPVMYGLGFNNNNCIACPKGTSPIYWARTRRFFPETFGRRARQSRAIGARLVRIKGVRRFLDELPADAPDAGAPDDDFDCGPACQMPLDFADPAVPGKDGG